MSLRAIEYHPFPYMPVHLLALENNNEFSRGKLHKLADNVLKNP